MTKENVSIRLEADVIERLDALTVKLAARAGIEVNRSATIRATMMRGIDELERELGGKGKKR